MAAPVVTYLFTLTNNLPGDIELDIGWIPRGKTFGTNVLSQDVRLAIASGSITCTPNVNLTPTPSAIINGLSSYTVASGSTLVDPGAGANRVNATIMANAIITMQGQIAYLLSMVEASDMTYKQGALGAQTAASIATPGVNSD